MCKVDMHEARVLVLNKHSLYTEDHYVTYILKCMLNIFVYQRLYFTILGGHLL